MRPLAVICTVPVAEPTAEGVNFTSAVHEAPGPNDERQVVLKSAKGGDTVNDESAAEVIAGLESVNVASELDVPTVTDPKSTFGGLKVGGGAAVPEPVMDALTTPVLAVEDSVPEDGPTAVGA
jgi:hypothetical protein